MKLETSKSFFSAFCLRRLFSFSIFLGIFLTFTGTSPLLAKDGIFDCSVKLSGLAIPASGVNQTLNIYKNGNAAIAAQFKKWISGEERTCIVSGSQRLGANLAISGVFDIYAKQALTPNSDSQLAANFQDISPAMYRMQLNANWHFYWNLRKGNSNSIRIYTSFIVSLGHLSGSPYLTHAADRSAGCTTAVGSANINGIYGSCEQITISESFFGLSQETGLLWSIMDWPFFFHAYQRAGINQSVEKLYIVETEKEDIISLLYKFNY